MSHYRRWLQPGGTFFFTLVTYRRERPFANSSARRILRRAITDTRQDHPFDIVALVLLHDHLHCLWQLPADDADFSLRWRLIKGRFTSDWLEGKPDAGAPTAARQARGERGVWQPRFWEHCIKDADDLKRHLDYIHYNPVKHGYVSRAADWPHSTFHRFVKLGEYDANWGRAEPQAIIGWSVQGDD